MEHDEYERLKQLIDYIEGIGEQIWNGYQAKHNHQCAAAALMDAFAPVTLVTIDSIKYSAESVMECADELEGGGSERTPNDLEEDIANCMEALRTEWLAFHSALCVLSQACLHLGLPIRGLVPPVTITPGVDEQSRPKVMPTIVPTNPANWNKTDNIH